MNEGWLRLFQTLVSIVCLIVLIESLRTGSTIALGRGHFHWVSKDEVPVRFWVANLILLALAILGFVSKPGRKI
ncbi:hypothetical protein NVV93_19040 [Pseudomonas sp. LS44]|uniref:hypothetical protein n=1 Tax=Pseudomonas sp. LS44 TaxID=1357074 RepID=UPI00215A2C79|nr:hypothetical protein [Pseudomonas sp. LS44]UVE17633.1 hypothetical protein NVV93_19040 [Pseudomonas sp. LS44]